MSSDRSVLSLSMIQSGTLSSISASIVRVRVDFAPTGVWGVLWDFDTPFDWPQAVRPPSSRRFLVAATPRGDGVSSGHQNETAPTVEPMCERTHTAGRAASTWPGRASRAWTRIPRMLPRSRTPPGASPPPE